MPRLRFSTCSAPNLFLRYMRSGATRALHTSARILARDSVEQVVGQVAALSRGEPVRGRVVLQ